MALLRMACLDGWSLALYQTSPLNEVLCLSSFVDHKGVVPPLPESGDPDPEVA